ncbi:MULTISPECIES: HIT family protein [Paenarthrobacter]|jgi:histidine triad (HIT) family protein|uniref:Histidine triad (HIT) family protein n=1 Tax=Paenarthrobacter nicotinovorans TaxID=29320 RepID=A0ABT9TIV2_PAENI|nr:MULTISPECIES: HIT family protein [Paenarthrobacter]KIA72461.1 histidine triad protein (HIT domain) [Arthrobacter sp. MWB30]KQR06475.1 diadenosine tetraphosphate hydrolase [Arthrobacter sp. Leaf145]SKB31526.1 histidine triad (HIT) family protein [Arthrobacter sp. 31Cvi3.1E]BCW11261.1 HIT family protein [Arthrobacter sp. NtRootA2]BCW15343.1 HIT family protein [Arthrobacter sp. NtRootA4]BCW23678.1 HIT family protein [Arthrobacter sp. NtRootC7]BCW27946.1 HIT family protein [Arthrobacter sp. N
MSTLFTRIINGEIPGRFVWKDEEVVAFLTIAPITQGHTLVVPREEVDSWTHATPELLAKVMDVAQSIGKVQEGLFDAKRVGVLMEGFEVDHLHVHVWPAYSTADFEIHNVDHNPDPAVMDATAVKLRSALRSAGHGDAVPED